MTSSGTRTKLFLRLVLNSLGVSGLKTCHIALIHLRSSNPEHPGLVQVFCIWPKLCGIWDKRISRDTSWQSLQTSDKIMSNLQNASHSTSRILAVAGTKWIRKKFLGRTFFFKNNIYLEIFPILVQSTKKLCSFCHWKCLGIEPDSLIKLEVLLDAELRTLATRPLDLLLFSFKKFVTF